MDSKKFNKIEEIYKDAKNLSPEDRAGFLKERCGGDDSLREEVESLLAFDTPSDQLISQTPESMVADLFSDHKIEDLGTKVVEDYELISKIGKGGMGTVYLARDKKLERRVSIKFLNKEFGRDPDRLRRFFLEARSASALNHPNIITIFEIGDTDGERFIVTEYIEGETLRRKMNRQRLDTVTSLTIAIQIASALEAAHSEGIVHRDIKPDNIMIRPDGVVKVLDFGIAKLTEHESGPGFLDGTKERTKPGTIVGSVNYMSPEQARGKEVDAQSDLFSLGIVLYLMLSGKLPFKGDTPSDVIASILKEQPEPLDSLEADVDPELMRIIEGLLEKEKEQRFESAREVLESLDRCRKRFEISDEMSKVSNPESIGAKITGDSNLVTAEETGKAAAGTDSPKSGGRFGWPLIGLAAAVFVATAAFGFWYASSGAERINSIAVLPFENEGGGEDIAYLADGLTEDLINDLSRIPDLSVLARSSVFRYQGSELAPKQIGTELGADAVLLGRIVMRDDYFTLNLELVEVERESVLWGEKFSARPSDLIRLQNQIASKVADRLRPGRRQSGSTVASRDEKANPEAYRAYLRGRYHWNKREGENLRSAIEYFQKAIELDPKFALAWSGLADSYAVIPNYSDASRSASAFEAKSAARKALALEPRLGEAHASLAHVLSEFDWKFAEAEASFKKALEYSPNYGTAYQWYAQHLGKLGRSDEAIRFAQQGVELEPFSLIAHYQLGEQYRNVGRLQPALQQFEKTYELSSKDTFWQIDMAVALVEMGDAEKAKTIVDEVIAKEGRGAFYLRVLASVQASLGNNKEAGKILEELEELKIDKLVEDYDLAVVCARLGEKDKALEYLNDSFKKREGEITYIGVDSSFDGLRDDQRFTDLIKKIGLEK